MYEGGTEHRHPCILAHYPEPAKIHIRGDGLEYFGCYPDQEAKLYLQVAQQYTILPTAQVKLMIHRQHQGEGCQMVELDPEDFPGQGTGHGHGSDQTFPESTDGNLGTRLEVHLA